jgi:hypothetical protein
MREMPTLPRVFAHIQTARHRGLVLFVRHSNESTRMIRKTRSSKRAM